MRTATVLVWLMACGMTGMAEAKSDRFAIAGAGARSCGQYLESRGRRDEALDAILASWIQGFLSGANVQRARTGGKMFLIPDSPSILAYVDKYCRDNPLKTIVDGAITLNRELE